MSDADDDVYMLDVFIALLNAIDQRTDDDEGWM